MHSDPDAVLLTGVYGSGKSAVAQELADLLTERRAPYAVLDLDFLGWFDTFGGGGDDGRGEHAVMLSNLDGLVTTYVGVGVRYFLLALAVRSEAELADLRAVLPMPLRVVRLVVGLPEIERRLRPDAAAGRRDDLREAARWLATGRGAGLEDLAVANDRPLREVATEVLEWLAWTNPS